MKLNILYNEDCFETIQRMKRENMIVEMEKLEECY